MKNKQLLIAGGIVAAVLIVGLFVLFGMKKATTDQAAQESGLPQVEVIPTVDASTRVTLEMVDKRGEVLLTIEGMPKGTESFEYELTYNTEGDVPQGALGTVTDAMGKSSYEKRICLCSESSGNKRYHKLTDKKINVFLKFNTSSGQRKFEKEFGV